MVPERTWALFVRSKLSLEAGKMWALHELMAFLQRAIARSAEWIVQLDRSVLQDSRQLCPQPSIPRWLPLPPIPQSFSGPVFLWLPDHLARLVPR